LRALDPGGARIALRPARALRPHGPDAARPRGTRRSLLTRWTERSWWSAQPGRGALRQELRGDLMCVQVTALLELGDALIVVGHTGGRLVVGRGRVRATRGRRQTDPHRGASHARIVHAVIAVFLPRPCRWA
jgi:hypothetical protein